MSEYTSSVIVCIECHAWPSLGHCDCHECPNCERWHTDTICTRCDECPECCECAHCGRSRCNEPVETVCERCEWCENCCECAVCENCHDRCESTCPTCECCDNGCCECSYCEGCQERHGQNTDFCVDCESCCDACTCDNTRAIHSYSTDVTESLAFLGKPESDIYLGVELEVQVEGSLSDKAQQWNEAIDDFAMLKEDSSIGHGFEIVTAPASLAVHQEKWTELLNDKSLVRGMKSWNATKNSHGDTSCGMHIHVSRAPLSQITIGKLMVFVNSPENTHHIEKIAGRPSNFYSRIIEKKITDGTPLCGGCDKRKKGNSNHSYCRRCKTTTSSYLPGNAQRFQAINLQNDATIEFRLFRGTLLLEHVLANIEFVDALIHWAMQASIQDCENWSALWGYVLKHAKPYKQLISYMDSH
jgi:hypothetical protein